MTKEMLEHLELFLLGQAGVALHYIKEWANAQKRDQEYQWKKAAPFAILSSITTGLAIYVKDDIASLYPITAFSAIVLGYFGNSAFFSFVNTVKPKQVIKKEKENENDTD